MLRLSLFVFLAWKKGVPTLKILKAGRWYVYVIAAH